MLILRLRVLIYYHMRKIELGGYDGLGFNARRFKLVYQVVSNENDRPDPSLWKTYDFTSNAINTSFWCNNRS